MRSIVAGLLLFLSGAPAVEERLHGADCNQNATPDEIDVSPALSLAVTGTFPLPPAPAALSAVSTTASGREWPLDLDNDGALDLAVAHYAIEGRVSILFNDGLGRYTRSFTVETGSGPRAMAAADIDGDAFMDLAVADSSFSGGIQDSGITLLLNARDGTLRAALRLSQGVRPSSVAAADLDEDGDVDIALATIDALVSVWKNEGDGEFRRRLQADAGRGIHALLAADFDRDGDVDLATGDAWDDQVSVQWNGGGAQFIARSSYPARLPYSLGAGDFDGDAFLDLLAAGALSRDDAPGYLSPLWNLGVGFAAGAVLEVAGGPSEAAPIDLDGDGRLDIAACGDSSGSVFLIRNRGSRSFVLVHAISVEGSLWAAAAGDVDGDGDCDLAAAMREPPSLVILGNDSLPATSPDNDHDGTPDECEGPLFVRGDANADHLLDIADAIALLLHLFQGGAGPPCQDSLDADDGGSVNAADAIFLLRALFLRERLPPEPFGSCGGDPTPDGLTCRSFPACS